jgi:hypothetical protein
MATHLGPSAPRAELTPVAPTCYGHRADSASNFPPPYHSFIFPYAKKKGTANAPSPSPTLFILSVRRCTSVPVQSRDDPSRNVAGHPLSCSCSPTPTLGITPPSAFLVVRKCANFCQRFRKRNEAKLGSA